jgi:Uma2 family endonuclease
MTVANSDAQIRPSVAAPRADDRSEEPVVPNPPLRRFVFEHVSWDYYTQTLSQLDRTGQHARVTFDRGRMEIMTVGRRHEIIKKAIGRLLEAFADEHEIDIEGVGNVTCRKQDVERGLEPDECYYVTSVYGGPDDVLDLSNNPPPDLAIEVEVSHGLGTRRAIYSDLGVPELWRFDGARVEVMELASGGTYKPVEKSRFFPTLDIAEFSQFVVRAIANQRTVIREYRKLLQSRKGPPRP